MQAGRRINDDVNRKNGRAIKKKGKKEYQRLSLSLSVHSFYLILFARFHLSLSQFALFIPIADGRARLAIKKKKEKLFHD